MYSIKFCMVLFALFGFAVCSPTPSTDDNKMLEEMRSSCIDGNDSLSCMKYKLMSFLDSVFKKDNYKIADDIEVRKNGYTGNNDITGRSNVGVLETVENYIQSHDVTFNVPIASSKVTISPRNLNDNEFNLKFKFADESREVSDEGKSKKSKLKKIVIPIMVFVLLKAMTLIPLALGVLGLKAWNALQLSFFSFMVSVALAIFQLCKKLAHDNHHPQIAAHGPWDAGRSFASNIENIDDSTNENGQKLAYNGYA